MPKPCLSSSKSYSQSAKIKKPKNKINFGIEVEAEAELEAEDSDIGEYDTTDPFINDSKFEELPPMQLGLRPKEQITATRKRKRTDRYVPIEQVDGMSTCPSTMNLTNPTIMGLSPSTTLPSKRVKKKSKEVIFIYFCVYNKSKTQSNCFDVLPLVLVLFFYKLDRKVEYGAPRRFEKQSTFLYSIHDKYDHNLIFLFSQL